MTATALLEYVRRELEPTPGRGQAAFRLTLACLAATIPIMTHRIPHGLVVMIVMYLVTVEDKAATLLATMLGWAGATVGLAAGLLAWVICLDIAWLRVCFFALFLFGGLFLKRIIAIPGLGSAIGLPAALAVVLPDVMVVPGEFSPSPETLVDFLLWMWVCMTVGLSVNFCVQLLLSRNDPLTLLEKEIDMRLRVVEETLLELAGERDRPETAPTPSLASLAIAGMSGQLQLLKTASLTNAWAHERHDTLAAIITLVDRLVTDAAVLRTLPALKADRNRLTRIAHACAGTRLAFSERRLPAPPEGLSYAVAGDRSVSPPPLLNMEMALEGIARVGLVRSRAEKHEGILSVLLVPDAFTNPEYVRFAIKGALAALICYALFVGFDYRGIYTSVITCFVVSLTTIGSSNQKGVLRFGGAAVGGAMGMFALIYLLPNVDTVGGFWLVFGAGTMAAAWANFGSPRISYGGYQTGLAFYKGVLHDVGMSLNLTVVRDRLVGVALGLTVFGMVEHFLWPERASDKLRARLAEILHLLSELARVGACGAPPAVTGNDVDSCRRLISQKVEDIQGLIESSKFELGAFKLSEIQKHTGDAQIVFILLLALARERQELVRPEAVLAAAAELDNAMATALLAVEAHVTTGSQPALPNLEGMMDAFENSVAAGTSGPGEAAADTLITERLAIYRALVAAIKRLSSEPLDAGQNEDAVRVLAVQ